MRGFRVVNFEKNQFLKGNQIEQKNLNEQAFINKNLIIMIIQ